MVRARAWTDDDLQALGEFLRSGQDMSEVAQLLGRWTGAVYLKGVKTGLIATGKRQDNSPKKRNDGRATAFLS